MAIPRVPFRERLADLLVSVGKEPCWLWPGHLQHSGYAHVRLDGKVRLAHRASYEVLRGPIPESLTIDHLCRVRHCFNPYHMEAVTHRVNILRGETLAAANLAKTHCSKGHEFTPENTRMKGGHRQCRECRRTAEAAITERRRTDPAFREHQRAISRKSDLKTRPPKGYMKGDGHYAAKITSEDVREIRRLRAEGVKLAVVAERFGIGQSAVSMIASRKAWTHVV